MARHLSRVPIFRQEDRYFPNSPSTAVRVLTRKLTLLAGGVPCHWYQPPLAIRRRSIASHLARNVKSTLAAGGSWRLGLSFATGWVFRERQVPNDCRRPAHSGPGQPFRPGQHTAFPQRRERIDGLDGPSLFRRRVRSACRQSRIKRRYNIGISRRVRMVDVTKPPMKAMASGL